jgi:hypothetical protein
VLRAYRDRRAGSCREISVSAAGPASALERLASQRVPARRTLRKARRWIGLGGRALRRPLLPALTRGLGRRPDEHVASRDSPPGEIGLGLGHRVDDEARFGHSPRCLDTRRRALGRWQARRFVIRQHGISAKAAGGWLARLSSGTSVAYGRPHERPQRYRIRRRPPGLALEVEAETAIPRCRRVLAVVSEGYARVTHARHTATDSRATYPLMDT